MRLVHRRGGPSLTTGRLVAGNLFRLGSLGGRRPVVLRAVTWVGFVLVKKFEHVLRLPTRKIRRHVTAVNGNWQRGLQRSM